MREMGERGMYSCGGEVKRKGGDTWVVGKKKERKKEKRKRKNVVRGWWGKKERKKKKKKKKKKEGWGNILREHRGGERNRMGIKGILEVVKKINK
jgi:hypothetical protein